MIQYKSIPNSIKDVDTKGRTVTGYFSSFGNVDSDGDIIRQGAFEKSVRERGPEGANRVFHLLQHNPRQPLGKPVALQEDDKGLYFETPFPDTMLANDTLKLYEAGIYSEHSIGFEVLNSNTDTNDGEEVNILTELKLWEGSTVTWGANENTPFEGVKSLKTPAEIADEIEQIQKFLRKGDVTDYTFELLELQLEHLKAAQPSKDTEMKPSQDTSVKELFDVGQQKLALKFNTKWDFSAATQSK